METTSLETLPKIEIPESYNYIGVFLMLGCNLTCSYCINHMSGKAMGGRPLSAHDWQRGLNRISGKIPLSLQGGEPSIHPEFLQILEGIPNNYEVDLLTNIQFNLEEFVQRISPERLKRDAPYASIRVSYHPETMNWSQTREKVLFLQDRGYHIGVWSVEDPNHEENLIKAKKDADNWGIDFRFKPLIGVVNGRTYGEYKYARSIGQKEGRDCECKTTELLIAPDGYIYRCHHDLYNRISPIGHLLDSNFQIEDRFRECSFYGKCNPCDVKIKNNRHQKFGHTSVEIINIRN